MDSRFETVVGNRHTEGLGFGHWFLGRGSIRFRFEWGFGIGGRAWRGGLSRFLLVVR